MDRYKYHRRARRPRLSHCSLDRQRNDHLGRSWSRSHLFKHRRQILRGSTGADTNSNSDPNGDCDCQRDCHCHRDCQRDCNSNCNCHRDCNAKRDTKTYADAKG